MFILFLLFLQHTTETEKFIMRGVGRDGLSRETKRRYTMNKIITKSVKVAVTAGALAAALTGCCMFGSNDCCGKKDCCKDPCACCCKEKCCGKKTSGVNTSMTVGVGTDGIHVGSDSNVGSHGASMHANTAAGANGMSAGAGGGVH